MIESIKFSELRPHLLYAIKGDPDVYCKLTERFVFNMNRWGRSIPAPNPDTEVYELEI